MKTLMHPSRSILPIGDRIVVQFREVQEELRGGLHIPDSAQEKPQEATIIALGSGRKTTDGVSQPFEVKVGDTVLVGKYGGAEIRLEDRKYTIVREDDILGIVS
jgi:chaperonin GroES